MHFPSVHKINASEKITRNTKRTAKKAKIDNSCSKILVGTINIKEVTEAKFLGVIFDSGLDWSIHVSQLIKKLKVASATIKRISHFTPASRYCVVGVAQKSRIILRTELQVPYRSGINAAKFQ